MLVRTISQLPTLTSLNNGASSYLEVSVSSSNDAGKYTSYKVAEKTIADSICNAVSSSIETTYGLKNGSSAINVNGMLQAVNVLSSGNQNDGSGLNGMLSGVKFFKSCPAIKVNAASYPTAASAGYENLGDAKYLVPNIDKVNGMLQAQPVYFSTVNSLIAEGNPLLLQSPSYGSTIGAGKFYFWRIDQNGQDSSNAVYDTRSKSSDGYEEMRDTGQLVMWGWLADSGKVEPQNAWVGLFARVKYEGGNNTYVDVPVSIQPWIRGEYASTLQYVGFTVPVQKGLKLKIKTGFAVSDASSGFQSGSTMTFIDRWVPNAFFGYVVKGDM